jgi:hypothetical protein
MIHIIKVSESVTLAPWGWGFALSSSKVLMSLRAMVLDVGLAGFSFQDFFYRFFPCENVSPSPSKAGMPRETMT